MWESCTVTKQGAQLLMTMNEIEIYTAKYGLSTVSDNDLKFQTDVTEYGGDVSILGKKSYEWGFELLLKLTNAVLTSEITVKQIGFFAREKGTEEGVLFAIAQDEIGDRIPSLLEMPNYSLELSIAVAASADAQINVIVDPTAVATIEYVEEVEEKLQEKIDEAKSVMKPATETESGTAGLVPAPTPEDAGKVLGSDGQWHDMVTEPMKPASETESGTAGLVPAPTPDDAGKVLGSDGQWHDIVTEPMKPATETESGTAGLVPAPTPDDAGKVLGSDGQWHDVSKVEIEQALAEGVKIATVTIDGKLIDLYCKDGVVYSDATTSAAGLMSAADKSKLDSGYVVKHDSGGYYVEV